MATKLAIYANGQSEWPVAISRCALAKEKSPVQHLLPAYFALVMASYRASARGVLHVS
jgi:hypothetical protein